jgi:hypothetical protein
MNAVTFYGGIALSFIVLTYALDSRGRRFILPFALACALASAYGFARGAWTFGVIEALICLIALRRASKFR